MLATTRGRSSYRNRESGGGYRSRFGGYGRLLLAVVLLLHIQAFPAVVANESSAADESPASQPPGLSNDDDVVGVRIAKDARQPSTRLSIKLPKTSKYTQYIAKVIDISEETIRDAVRTFLASVLNASVINIHNLHAGHRYKIQLHGRRATNDTSSVVFHEEDVAMEPAAPDFGRRGATIDVALHNITMKTTKPEKAIQDSFIISYRQVDPEQLFPPLEVSDIADQKDLEIYLANLNAGRDYAVSVVAVKDGVQSRPWQSTIATKPEEVTSLSATDVPPSCVNLTWLLPPSSGVDHFEVAYGEVGEGASQKATVPAAARSLLACDGLAPGVPAAFSVTAVKSSVASTPRTLEHTLRPRPPFSLQVRPDTWSGKYRIWAELPGEGRADGCVIAVVSETTLERVESTARPPPAATKQTADANATASCEFLLPLKPGERYELSMATSSAGVLSTKVGRSIALPPAFDMNAFGISVQESRGGLEIAWPSADDHVARLRELWSKMVGVTSLLHARVTQWRSSASGDTRQYETSPSTLRPLFISNLTMGACYKVQLYTVTSTGIVSESRFDEAIRMSPPAVEVALHSVARTVASLRMTLSGSVSNASVAECQMLLVVTDQHGLAVFDRRLPLPSPAADVPLDGLRPFHKYNANTQVLCGSASSACSPTTRTMRSLSFVTRQDRPGPVLGPTVVALNAVSARLSWQPPALPNGLLTHYVIAIQPEDGSAEWSVNVGASGGGAPPSLSSSAASSDSSSATDEQQQRSVDAVVDGLRGGREYRFLVRAVTEAGAGDPPAASDASRIIMPIEAPPRPSVAPSIVESSIGSYSLSVQLPAALFDAKHGAIIRTELLVSQTLPDGRIPVPLSETSAAVANSSITHTWSEVQAYDSWPTYVAIVVESTSIDSNPPAVQEIGTDASCDSLPSSAVVCNGPLRPAASYRVKLRLFTAPALYTDSPYSGVVRTGSDVASASIWLLAIGAAALLAIAAGALLLCRASSSRRHRGPSTPIKRGPPTSFGNGGASSNSKEGQWAALRMVMAERAAECLARLGFDAPGPAAAPGDNMSTRPDIVHHLAVSTTPVSSNGSSSQTGSSFVLSPMTPLQQGQQPQHPTLVRNATTRPPVMGVSGGQLLQAPTGGGTNRRRAGSLRERTGVSHRLDGLPGLPNRPPSTIVAGVDTDRTRPVPLQRFAEHVKIMSADTDFRFSEEYELLRNVGIGAPCGAADLPVNRVKNRFSNILPYDHSRVKLLCDDDTDGEDYINANFIPGASSRREFIAAQGPLPCTRDAFWRMVVEQSCPVIVALTRCIEKGRDKCHQYWPDRDHLSLLYGDIEVTMLSETQTEDTVIRDLRLTPLNAPASARTITHMHYMAWPDFGVPDTPRGILRFQQAFRHRLPRSPNNKPTVVHCSAGVGRSGTFVAIDRLLETIGAAGPEQPLDVFGVVHEMRNERCSMVQNEGQYIFIHHALLFAIQHPEYGNATMERSSASSPARGSGQMTSSPVISSNNAAYDDDEGIAESGL